MGTNSRERGERRGLELDGAREVQPLVMWLLAQCLRVLDPADNEQSRAGSCSAGGTWPTRSVLSRRTE